VLDNESPSADRPTTTKRKVKTNAIVNNGETIILGGLIKNAGGKGVQKVPFLGDIPVLGEMFFTHNSDLSRETNVVIYLTPYIVRRSDDLQKLKKMLSELEEVQGRYNEYVRSVLEGRRKGNSVSQKDCVTDRATSSALPETSSYSGSGSSNLDVLKTLEEF
jgi:general secretion pathway protein D